MSIFLNPKTGSVWELYVKNRRLQVNVPNFSFEISPASVTRFRPINTQVNLEFEFEKPPVRNHLLLHVYAKGIKRATFETSQADLLLPKPIKTQSPAQTAIITPKPSTSALVQN